MLELPEAIVISKQLNSVIHGKRISNVIADYSHHKFAWYYEDPQKYNDLLKGKAIENIQSLGGMIEIKASDAIILFADGVRLRYHSEREKHPDKHQLLIEFDDHSAISATIQMYGGLWCFKEYTFDNIYYKISKEKPSPFSEQFDMNYFDNLISSGEVQTLSAKAFLATEQRIPGLGNGVLQDILYNAKIHPKRKINTLSSTEIQNLFQSIKATLEEMVSEGARDTEKDLFGQAGGYRTKVSKNTLGQSCSVCGNTIEKGSYLGGSIYYCEGCQAI